MSNCSQSSICLKLQHLFFGVGILILRIGIGAGMMTHGLAKFNNYSELVKAGTFPDPLGFGIQTTIILAILTELVFSITLCFGFLTRLSALAGAITMFTAIFIVHKDDLFTKWELAYLYFIPYLTLIFTGGSYFSADRLISKKMHKKKI